MVCSACGFENQAAMRFCGMCGMPLPHRPITAPGAQSTLNFTRVPVDMGVSAREEGGNPRGGGSVVLETPPASTQSDPPEAMPSANSELVPDIPLDEYVQKFRYEPPRDAAEVTMRGDLHTPVPPEDLVKPADNIIASSSATEVRPEVVAVDDVDHRLGLEPETPAEARIQRPRFLEINEPADVAPPAASGTSSIAGPSFLGLSDTPQTWAEAVGVDYKPHSGRWRVWLALAVVVIVVVLAGLEWRSQTGKTFSAEGQVIGAKLRDWWHQAVGPDNDSAASDADAESHAAPVVQVPEQSKPQTPPPTGNAENGDGGQSNTVQPGDQNAASPAGVETESGSAATKPDTAPSSAPAAANKPAEQTSAAPATNGAGENSAQPTTEVSKSKRPAKGSEQEAETRQNGPGSEEMNKAKNASDAAATAAWLWKATAKGNPDAPVQLANMYVQGSGVPRSCEQAVVLLKTAAAKENASARNRLAWMYSTGTCVARSRVDAYHWLNAALAANPNSQWAKQNRDQLWQQMTPEERASAGR